MVMVDKYKVPEDLYYTRDHAWIKIEGNRIRIGITDFTQQMAGEITFIRLPRVGKDLETDKTLFSLQSGKWAGKVLVPVAGRVTDVNTALAISPAPLNSDPYGEGWIAVMEPVNMAAIAAEMLHGEKAIAFLKEEIAKHAK
jgi:glycine cleavage system H protein